jgi:hypothetical protein
MVFLNLETQKITSPKHTTNNMTAKQHILAKFPKSYCTQKKQSTYYIAYAEPTIGNIVGIGNTSAKAWENLLSILQKENEI